jgi:hypothetical protein
MDNSSTIKSRYDKLDTNRFALVERARECAELTVPSLMPPEGYTEADELSTPHQSLGARAINNLASKLLLTILPPNSAFFRLKLSMDKQTQAELEARDPQYKEKMDTFLAEMERAIVDFMESKCLRVSLWKALRLLVVTGNALLYFPEDSDRLKVYPIDRYVVLRDGVGRVLEIISKEEVHPSTLSDELRQLIEHENMTTTSFTTQKDENVEIYTKVRRVDEDTFEADQEVQGKLLSELTGKKPKRYKQEELRWIPLRWTQADSDHYGRGHVEEYLGDFYSLEGLSQNLLESTAITSLLIWMVNPNGVTDTQDLEKADNGSFISGNRADVEALQSDKSQDLSVAIQFVQGIESRLEQAFLLHSSVQRHAERVTAEEIRYMAQELEDALGGIYSVMATELQLPLVKLVMSILRKKKKLPKFGEEELKPVITTGLEALSRGHDLNKMMQLLEVATQLGEGGLSSFNTTGFLQRASANLGLDSHGILKTQEQIAQEQQQAQQMQMAQQVMPQVTEQIMAQQQQQATGE